jgi:hypothetical protein
MLSRRAAGGLLLAPALQSVPFQATPQEPSTIRELNLQPDLMREVIEVSRRQLQQASLLRDLPLDGVFPGFVFMAR